MEKLDVSLDSLRASADSEKAKKNSEKFNSVLRTGIIVVKRCADSRLVLPNTALEISSISGGGPRSPYSDLLKSESVIGIVMLSHHDGTTVKPGSIPSGCGGREGFIGKDEAECMDEGVRRFLHDHVWSADPLKQSIIGASFSSKRAQGKPALAATMDHLDLSIYPTGYVEGQLTVSPINIHELLAPEYFPADIYKDGIPMIDNPDRWLNAGLKRFLNDASEVADLYRRKYRLSQMQRTQNPGTVFLTTETHSPRWRFPQVFDMPGSFFQLSLARPRLNDGSVYIDQKYAEIALDQIEYPVSRFSKTNTIIIESRTIDTSAHLAKQFRDRKYGQEWLSNRSNQIILLETTRGQTNYFDLFDKT